MIPFEQQLRAIVEAVTFASPERALVTSSRGAQREAAVRGQRDAFGGLTIALYMDHYSLAPAVEERPASATGAAFVAALQAANPITYRYQEGFTVLRANAGGVWLADAAGQQRFAALSEIVPLANAIAPGLPVRLVPRRGQPGPSTPS